MIYPALAPRHGRQPNGLSAKMTEIWRTIFSGSIEGRPVTLKIWDDGDSWAARVETNYNKDQIIGDLPGAIGVPVAWDDVVHIDAETTDELESRLVEEGEFSRVAAKQIIRLVPPRR